MVPFPQTRSEAPLSLALTSSLRRAKLLATSDVSGAVCAAACRSSAAANKCLLMSLLIPLRTAARCWQRAAEARKQYWGKAAIIRDLGYVPGN